MMSSISSVNARSAALQLSEEDRIQIERKYRVIEPILKPSAFGTIWKKNTGKTVKVIDRLAIIHRLKRRTIYNWLAAWRRGGESALVRKNRRDKGIPRLLTEDARGFLCAAVYSEADVWRRPTVRAIYHHYRAKIAAGELQPPAASYSTVRIWIRTILRNGSHIPVPTQQLFLAFSSRRKNV